MALQHLTELVKSGESSIDILSTVIYWTFGEFITSQNSNKSDNIVKGPPTERAKTKDGAESAAVHFPLPGELFQF